MQVKDIYQWLDTYAAFAGQERWDNSGLLVGSMEQTVQGVLLTLDISPDAVEEAVEKHCDLILAHHPVIFDPLRQLPPAHPVYQLAQHGVAAICTHTPLDKASGGVNSTLFDLLRPALGLEASGESLEDGFGMAVNSREAWDAGALAAALQACLGCTVVRYASGRTPIRRIGFACGSGGSMLEEAIAAGCDAFITGDVKHDRWYAAQAAGIALFDCGHYHLEVPVMRRLERALQQAFPSLPVQYAAANRDPVQYYF